MSHQHEPPMPRYIVIIATKEPFTPALYAGLYQHFEKMKRGMHIGGGAIVFDYEEPMEIVRKQLSLLLHEGDEFYLFEFLDACSQIFDAERTKRFRDFFCTKHP